MPGAVHGKEEALERWEDHAGTAAAAGRGRGMWLKEGRQRESGWWQRDSSGRMGVVRARLLGQRGSQVGGCGTAGGLGSHGRQREAPGRGQKWVQGQCVWVAGGTVQ